MPKYYFNNSDRAYEFQARLAKLKIDSDLVNELTRKDYSIKLVDASDEIVADHVYGVFLTELGVR